ncbi:probably inactive receptor-like protein kinase [Tanacetum coccineum]|uniref:Probably inactive receptor-like protein kinase n=1 Tax=Tanacetum coccineum TaxID=301880 RepID=A0ABQ5AHA3_9ASTR
MVMSNRCCKVHCTTETDLIQVLSRVKILSEVTHPNMANVLGCSIDSGYTPLVVYEHPGNGTLEQHLCQAGIDGKIGLDWHNRLTITAQLSSVLAYLQTEVFPPVHHHGLQSGCVLLDHDMNGNIEEVVDPMLYYHEQPLYRKEQMGIVADVGTRCLLFSGDGQMGMNDVARELVHVTKESIDHVGSRRGPAGLEETFSNSSVLQMISLSSDSIYVP